MENPIFTVPILQHIIAGSEPIKSLEVVLVQWLSRKRQDFVKRVSTSFL